jgi:hypothetical protein|tara:strand:- start:1198 stop:2436 length:1239 start_codon:yes stop_codon:yes gene_type:complete
MFNPKENLLDQQLAESGLELEIKLIKDLVTGGAYSRNKTAAANERAAKKHQKKIADLTNKHNRKLDKADKENYRNMRNFQHESNIRNWKRGKEIQDFQYLSQMQQYQKSQAIGNAQLGLNAEAMAQGIDAEKNVIEEAFIQQQFEHEASMSALKEAYTQGMFDRRDQNIQLAGIRSKKQFGMASLQNELNQQSKATAMQKESAMIDSLVAMGTAQLGQAGKSTAKGVQANMAALQRSLMALDTEMSGRNISAHLQMAELQTDTSLSEMSVGINLERIDNSIANAESEAEGNLEVMRQNMKSKIQQAERNVNQIGLERQFADVNTRAGMMIEPTRLPYDPRPKKSPKRIFVKRMKVIPGFVPQAQQENLWAAGLNTAAQVVGTVSGVASAGAAVAQAGGLNNLATNIFTGVKR